MAAPHPPLIDQWENWWRWLSTNYSQLHVRISGVNHNLRNTAWQIDERMWRFPVKCYTVHTHTHTYKYMHTHRHTTTFTLHAHNKKMFPLFVILQCSVVGQLSIGAVTVWKRLGKCYMKSHELKCDTAQGADTVGCVAVARFATQPGGPYNLRIGLRLEWYYY